MSNLFRDNGGKLPAGLQYVKNWKPRAERITSFRPEITYLEIPFRYQIVAVRKDPDSPYYPWVWSCQICPGEPDLGENYDKCISWKTAYEAATHHAHNHH